MIQRWQTLLADPAARRSLLLLVLCAIAAIPIGFVLVKPVVAERLIVHGGYYYILMVFALWLFFGWRVAELRNGRSVERLRGSWKIGLFLGAATAFAVWTDSFAHKVLFDEYVLQGTAWHMHLTKEVGTPLRA